MKTVKVWVVMPVEVDVNTDTNVVVGITPPTRAYAETNYLANVNFDTKERADKWLDSAFVYTEGR